jgi:hypothetical protein
MSVFRTAMALVASVAFLGCNVENVGPAAKSGAGGAGSSAGDETPGATGCPAGSAELEMDGVMREISDEGVALRAASFGAEVYHAIEIDDALRSGNLAENLWQRFVAPRFTKVGELVDGGSFERESWVRGSVTEVATGASAYVGLAPGPKNGVAYPVIVIAADQASFDAQFPDFGTVSALRRYNDFPLSCASIVGKWTTSSATAADTFSATGFYTGMTVVSDSLDLALSADGSFTREWSAMVNGSFSRGSDQGSYTTGAREIVLAGQSDGTTAYDAHLIAVKGGFSLYLVNRQFTGMAYGLVPSK